MRIEKITEISLADPEFSYIKNNSEAAALKLVQDDSWALLQLTEKLNLNIYDKSQIIEKMFEMISQIDKNVKETKVDMSFLRDDVNKIKNQFNLLNSNKDKFEVENIYGFQNSVQNLFNNSSGKKNIKTINSLNLTIEKFNYDE